MVERCIEMLPADKKYPLTFEKVNRIAYPDWPIDWLDESEPGDLLEGSLDDSSYFALLCVDHHGGFITLNNDQVYNQARIPWPGSEVKAIMIKGSQIALM